MNKIIRDIDPTKIGATLIPGFTLAGSQSSSFATACFQRGTLTSHLLDAEKSGTRVPTENSSTLIAWISEVTKAFRPLEKQLDEIRLETENWNREAEAPSEQAFDDAQALLSRLKMCGFRPDRVVHSAEGGIGFYFRRGRRYADFECSNLGRVTAVVSDGSGNVRAFDVETSFEGHKGAIEKVRAFLLRS
jgi:hypothetical protein